MFVGPAAGWYHSNRYSAGSVCEHCGGMVRHERWCVTRDALVRYAFSAVADPDKLTVADALILHALGVSWGRNRSEEAYKQCS